MSSAAHALPRGELVLDRYRPLRPLGSGGSGSVWLARDERNGLDVALKIIPREGKAAHRAEREAEAASRLRHERCLRAYGLDAPGLLQHGMRRATQWRAPPALLAWPG